MAVFRVERIKDYTVMSNHHLRNKNLSLKAKGLLSQMLSLPDDWDYTLKGLAAINKESVDAIRTAIWELEDTGYVVRTRVRDDGDVFAVFQFFYEFFARLGFIEFMICGERFFYVVTIKKFKRRACIFACDKVHRF